MATLEGQMARTCHEPRVFAVRTDPNPIFHIDWLMLMAAGAVTTLGLVMIYSTTKTSLELSHLSTLHDVERQALALGIGLVGALWRRWSTTASSRSSGRCCTARRCRCCSWCASSATTAAAPPRGSTWGRCSSSRPRSPSSTVIVALAGYCQQHRGELDAWRLAVALTLAGIPMGLVMLQNDLGTMLVMGVCVIAVLVRRGAQAPAPRRARARGRLARGRADHHGHVQHAIGPTASHVSSTRVQGGAEERHVGAVQPRAVEERHRPRRALGPGAVQRHAHQDRRVPEQHTDFIFTAVGEELGFPGGALLLGLYALLVWRTLADRPARRRLLRHARSPRAWWPCSRSRCSRTWA